MQLVWTLAGTDTVTTFPDPEGFFSLMALPAGTYDVHVHPDNIAYTDTVVTNVDVTAGNNTDIGVIDLNH